MNIIDYFKLQAKNLHRDFKTQFFDGEWYDYTPRFFDVTQITLDFDPDEEKLTLMYAQHLIAKMAGFRKWTRLLKASDAELQLAKLLFDNMHKIKPVEWEMYLVQQQDDSNVIFDAETRLEIFTMVFANVDGHESMFADYRLKKKKITPTENQPIKSMKKKSTAEIFSLPLTGANRKKFIETANSAFERVIERVEPEHPELVRELWNPEEYIDVFALKPDILPVDRDYALSLIDTFMVHHVIALAVQTDID
ncbi:hypothetical protein GS399_04795 [Pedobacter sp. HMF7647]|uniref:Uncharacterized protein n=1 Tax=Hufsiella arboris TaxID=2695275 RepID=A0A7K1Y762_9SPHI|nr:hypothetical protein [Hufsiella arboris]MXV50280.1 hypothetical protein [Hufsiella arboris]